MMQDELSKALLICEGETEMAVANKLCDNFSIDRNIVQLEANGNSRYRVIANKINDQVLTFKSPSPIIVLFDREKNSDSPEVIIREVERELGKLGQDVKQFIIGVADPYIESWILPFVDINGNYPVEPTTGSDGKRCIGELEKRLKKQGKQYKKMKTGTEILCGVNPQKLAAVSASFKRFYEQIKDYCNW